MPYNKIIIKQKILIVSILEITKLKNSIKANHSQLIRNINMTENRKKR